MEAVGRRKVWEMEGWIYTSIWQWVGVTAASSMAVAAFVTI